jgi:hypothetical protein
MDQSWIGDYLPQNVHSRDRHTHVAKYGIWALSRDRFQGRFRVRMCNNMAVSDLVQHLMNDANIDLVVVDDQ